MSDTLVASRTADNPVPNSSGSAPPRFEVPAGTVDCHHHIFDPRFPKPAGKPMRAIATVQDYELLKSRLGIRRSVVVAPASYATNDCLLDALAAFGDESRGVAIVDAEASIANLKVLDAQRVRGARFYLVKGNPASAEALKGFSRKAADLGWHVEIMPSQGDKLVQALDMLLALDCPVVIDHFGYTPQPGGLRHPAVGAMKRLLDTGRGYVKLSGVYFTSKLGFPDYADLDELAVELVRYRPDRMVWGTDWPHSGEQVKPDDSKLLDQTTRWTEDAAVRRAILVDNPNRLYWAH